MGLGCSGRCPVSAAVKEAVEEAPVAKTEATGKVAEIDAPVIRSKRDKAIFLVAYRHGL